MIEYLHGGDLIGAQKKFGIAKENIVDFSSNVNPVGFPPKLNDIILNNLQEVSKYPDNNCSHLKKILANYLNVEPDMIIPGNGAMEILKIIIEYPKIKNILIPSPTFIEYEKIAEIANIHCNFLELKSENDFKLNTSNILDDLDKVDAIILCNPNNPTSKLYDKDKLISIIEKASKKNVLVIIDETFIELTIDGNKNSLAEYVNNYENLVIIRAFTKYFAIPGIRLGYAIVPRFLANYCWKIKPTWSLNTFATKMGELLKEEDEHRFKTLNLIKSEKEYLFCNLANFKQFKIYPPNTIFILIEILLDDLDANKIFERLGKKGILIRKANNFRFLNEKYIRVSVKSRNDNKKLINALKSAVEENI